MPKSLHRSISARTRLQIDLVKENEFWFDTQTPNLPVSVSVQVKVACGSYCTPVINSGATHYWRLNDHQGGAGPYRDVIGGMDQGDESGYAPTTSDGRLPADAEAGSASVHTSQAFETEPNDNGRNYPIGTNIPNQPIGIYALGGWVKQDSDQSGHAACFLEGSPINGTDWLCRDTAGNLSFSLDVVCNGSDHFFNAGAGALLDDGRWHYVLGRQDDSNNEAELWVDGTLVGTAAKPIGG